MLDPRDLYSPRHAIADDGQRITRMADAAVSDVASPHSPRHAAPEAVVAHLALALEVAG